MFIQLLIVDKFSKEKRSKIMAAIKSKNTKSEVLLAKKLWHRGNRYRKNDKTIFGTPDLTFRKLKIAVFVDSEFFHGKDWNTLRERLDGNREFWVKKIERNMSRDEKVNEYLLLRGWKVLRFWSADVTKKTFAAVRVIENEIASKRKMINYLDSPFPDLYTNKKIKTSK